MGVGGGLRAKYMLPCFRIRDSIQFGKQSDHVLEKWNFYLLTPGSGDGVSWAPRAKYLLPCCCIHVSLECDMQHNHVPKKLNFDVLTPPTRSTQGVWHRPSIKTRVLYVSYLL